jgi:hypothetical protein
MQYAPVLLKINSVVIKKAMKANYLLQVWRKGGRKVFERPL